jgi:serine/threonine-protein kinase
MSKSSLLVRGLGVLLVATLSACGAKSAAINPVAPAVPAVSPKDEIPLVLVAAGKFEMGSDHYRDEEPLHVVGLRSFLIDQTEVTNAEYAHCLQQGFCQPPQRLDSYSRPEYFGNPQYDAYPVIYVTWDDADTFCKWAGRRLPTEAEWERAARGSDERIYPWGDQPPQANFLNYDFNLGDTSPTGDYPLGASPYQVLDMAGNVAEWVADWYDPAYYSESPYSDPGDSLATKYRVVRGGSWIDNRYAVRAGLRRYYPPDSAFVNLGFRCAESTPAPQGSYMGGGHRTLR